MEFSVLMSVYHKEKPSHLYASLSSIFNQTLPPSEIILVEDGPLTDELYSIIEGFTDRYPDSIIRLPLPTNRGLGIALNEGMHKCNHEVIARMDADDVAAEDRFEKQIRFLQDHPAIDMTGSNITEYDDSLEKVLSFRNVPKSHDDIVLMMKTRSPFNHMSVVYKKSAVLACGGYEHCPSFEDYYLWCKMARAGVQFHNLQSSLIKMRTDSAISKRRGGLEYMKNTVHFQMSIYKLGIITRSEFVYNLLIRLTVAAMPGWLRVLFYKRALRSAAP